MGGIKKPKDAAVRGKAMRISDTRIAELQKILKKHFGLEYDKEQAQRAGRAIMRLAGIKLYQQFTKEYEDEQKQNVKNI